MGFCISLILMRLSCLSNEANHIAIYVYYRILRNRAKHYFVERYTYQKIDAQNINRYEDSYIYKLHGKYK